MSLEALWRLAEKAMPRPWRVRPMRANEGGCRELQAHAVSAASQRQQWSTFAQTDGQRDDDVDKATAHLIVAAVNALPDLLAERDETQAKLDAIVAELPPLEPGTALGVPIHQRVRDLRLALAELEAEVRRLPLVPYTNYLERRLLIGADEQTVAEDEVPRIAALFRRASQ